MITLDIPAGEFAAYLFDCDGTLADTMPLHYRAWRAVLDPLGCEFPEDVFYSIGGMPTGAVVDFLNERNGLSLPSMRLAEEKEEVFMTLIPDVKPVASVVDFMLALEGKYPLAVASGGFKSVVTAILETLGLLGHFQTLVTAEDVIHGKPAPDTYLEAARRLCVAPARCLVFEDTPLGRESALNAGMQCVLVPSGMVVERAVKSKQA